MALANKVALIAGGVKNLGAQIARELAGQGASLALHYNSASSQKQAQALEAELRQNHPNIKVSVYQGDLTSAAAVTKLFRDTLRDFGHIDIVVNTVGKVLKKPITEISEEEYNTMFAYVLPASRVYMLIDLVIQDQLQGSVLHSQGGRCPYHGRWQDYHHRHRAARCVHRVLHHLCRQQGARRALHPRRVQGAPGPGRQCQQHCSWPHGYPYVRHPLHGFG